MVKARSRSDATMAADRRVWLACMTRRKLGNTIKLSINMMVSTNTISIMVKPSWARLRADRWRCRYFMGFP
jgi:hypothetical protein